MATDKQTRARELERVFQMRRGHAPQISISDDNHHVTEAIGDLYGGDSDSELPPKRSSRPLSFLPSPNGDSIQSFGSFEPFDPFPTSPPAKSPLRPVKTFDKPTASPASAASDAGITIPQRKASLGRTMPNGQMSPPLSRSNSDTASQQFPLNNLDYESSAAGLAQELSNLQAIRRMSMGVNNADPDLPSFKSANSPPLSPTISQEDEQQLFWVPARLHPELAPKEFKTFIEEKVDRIRRRSGDSDTLSSDGALGRKGSGDGLRRKKSMLSRQIDTGSGYKDGADRLERKRSEKQANGGLANLSELEHIVEDPVALVRRMSMDSKGSDGEAMDDDSPIIAGKPGGMGTLKRSTRTTYRRGSLRKGGPALSRRRQTETDADESPATSPTHPLVPQIPPLPFSRVQSEPINGAFDPTSNFSRPQRRRSPPNLAPDQRPGSSEDQPRPTSSEAAPPEERPRPQARVFHSRIASNGRTTAPLPGYVPPQQVPQIIETPPPQEQRQQLQLPERLSSRQPLPVQYQQQPNQPQSYSLQQQQQMQQQQQLQQQQQMQLQQQQQLQQMQQQRQAPPIRQNQQPQSAQSSPIKPAQTFDELIQHPMPLPGNNARVDSLSIIPNLPDEKKDKKSKDKKDEGPRKTSWGWLVGGDKDKEREKREKEEREKELAKKVKNKLSKPQEKSHDDARLDVLQTSLQGGNRGRESVVIDRDNVKLEEERRKESGKKAAGDGKKEKEPGLLSSIFGGGKKKSEKDPSSKKNSARGLSPEPPPRILKPDIDYNWTRFSILEERAIYRMAHIKLANPRRELYSQVLLSNFMYSYLAKVQQMHPQISIGNSKQARQAQQAQQKKEQQQQQQQQAQQQQQQQQQHISQQQQQPDEFAQYQRYQKQQEQSDKANEWPSYQQQQQQHQHDPSHRSPQENGQHLQQQQHMYNQNPRDSHHSQYSANGGGGGSGGGGVGGYSVSNTQNYLGQTSKGGYNMSNYSDSSDQSHHRGSPATATAADDDMW